LKWHREEERLSMNWAWDLRMFEPRRCVSPFRLGLFDFSGDIYWEQPSLSHRTSKMSLTINKYTPFTRDGDSQEEYSLTRVLFFQIL
jgi:hypothetical protein